jgi:sigma-B regulation protein RsbU (phosphoserine phosphatase)
MAAKILLVDDEPDFELLVRKQLRKHIQAGEFEFVFANSGVDALKKLEADATIDLVMTDINMPEMDGLTLLGKLNESKTLLRAVIVSAYGDMANIRTAMNRGAFDFLTKPIDFQDLEITIRRTIQELANLKDAARNRDKLLSLEKELNIAREIQQSILPRDFSLLSDRAQFAIHAEMQPAREVGGDFYDFFLIDPNRVAFVIGDVSGKGVPAAIFMAMTRALLKSTAMKGISPSACLQDINNALFRDNGRSMFVSVLYGVLNIQTGEMTYCNAGHNPPMMMIGGNVEPLEKVGGIVCGAIFDSTYDEKKIKLHQGDMLFLYTDGVTEAMDSGENLFTEPRLIEILQATKASSPPALIEEVFQAVKTFAGDAPQADDITALAIKYG